MEDRMFGFEDKFEIAPRNPPMFECKRFRPRTFTIPDGHHNRAMLLGRSGSQYST
jgi:hypothetical protein